MKKRFFEPYIGPSYIQGINGKKVLIVGASFYCAHIECPFFMKCTSVQAKDSSKYDAKCPVYKEMGRTLHDEPSNSVSDEPSTYVTFANGMSQFVGGGDYTTVWDHVAFTNYVQFFLPGSGASFRPTTGSDISERDFEAFLEVVKRLAPDVIIIWGCVINSRLKEQNEFVFDKDLLKSTDYYLCHMRVPGVSHDIALVNPNHPSSSAWHSDKAQFDKYLKKALELC